MLCPDGAVGNLPYPWNQMYPCWLTYMENNQEPLLCLHSISSSSNFPTQETIEKTVLEDCGNLCLMETQYDTVKILVMTFYCSVVPSLSCLTGVGLPSHPVPWESLQRGAADSHGPAPQPNLGWHPTEHPAGWAGPSTASFSTGQNLFFIYFLPKVHFRGRGTLGLIFPFNLSWTWRKRIINNSETL